MKKIAVISAIFAITATAVLAISFNMEQNKESCEPLEKPQIPEASAPIQKSFLDVIWRRMRAESIVEAAECNCPLLRQSYDGAIEEYNNRIAELPLDGLMTKLASETRAQRDIEKQAMTICRERGGD